MYALHETSLEPQTLMGTPSRITKEEPWTPEKITCPCNLELMVDLEWKLALTTVSSELANTLCSLFM